VNAAIIVNGVLLGGFYALAALGMSLVFGVLRLVNLAHGAILGAGAYLAAYVEAHLPVPWPIAAIIAMVTITALGYLLQRHLLTTMLVRGENGPLVATFGLSLIITGIATLVFGSNPVTVPSSLGTAGWSIAGINVRAIYVVAFALGLALSVALHILLTRTRLGGSVRAAAADPRTAQLMGIDVDRVYAWVFATASAIAALAGILVGVAFSVGPTSGTGYLLIAMAVVVIGGVGNVLGTFAAAVALGLIQTSVAAVIGGGYRDLIVYLVFFLVLSVLPQGVFGRRAA